MHKIIDLRSDTVTRPTPAMRQAMANAEVGDDVYREDPTVNRLQERAAEIFEREDALFVPSGTMGNQAAIKVHTSPGQEVICEARAHIYNAEMATMAAFSGCLARPIEAPDGILTWDRIAPWVRARTDNRSRTGLISLENTANLAGGSVYPASTMEEICDRAHAAGLPVHLDGARIFNAAVALNSSVADLTRGFDSIMFCFSKSLGAPVGSMLVGSRKFIEEARLVRKMLGGGMRRRACWQQQPSLPWKSLPSGCISTMKTPDFLRKVLPKFPPSRSTPLRWSAIFCFLMSPILA